MTLDELIDYYQHEADEKAWAGSLHARRSEATAEALEELKRLRETRKDEA